MNTKNTRQFWLKMIDNNINQAQKIQQDITVRNFDPRIAPVCWDIAQYTLDLFGAIDTTQCVSGLAKDVQAAWAQHEQYLDQVRAAQPQ